MNAKPVSSRLVLVPTFSALLLEWGLPTGWEIGTVSIREPVVELSEKRKTNRDTRGRPQRTEGAYHDGPSPALENRTHVFAATSTTDGLSTRQAPKTAVSNRLAVTVNACWLTGMAVMLARLVAASWILTRLATRSRQLAEGVAHDLLERLCQELDIQRKVQLYVSHAATPMTWGVFTPRVVLPAEWERWKSDRLRAVLVHELSHVKRWDVLTQLLAQVAFAVQWYNPLVWLAAWRIRVERERACDNMVLRGGVRASVYAEHLLAIATGGQPIGIARVSAMAMARSCR